MIANNLTAEKTIPDFRDHIYAKGLESKTGVGEHYRLIKAMNYQRWTENRSLDQSLLIAMNDEGRWMINNKLTSREDDAQFQRLHIHERSRRNKSGIGKHGVK